MELKLVTPSAAELQAGANKVLTIIQNFTIDSPMMYEAAGGELKMVKAKQKELEAQRKAITVPLDDAKKSTMALFKPAEDILNQAEAVLKNSMLTYADQQERLRREQQALLDEAARIERERLAEASKAAEEAGNVEEAEALQATASMTTAPVVAQSVEKVSGISTRTNWKAEVTDLLALVKFVAANPHMIDLLQVNTTTLNQHAKATKDNTKIDGVRVYSEQVLASRAA
jgi:hypothetical protein